MSSHVPLPASMTKHLDVLHHAFPGDPATRVELVQRSVNASDGAGGGTGTTGTTLWLGAQVMAAYVGETLGKGNKKVLELGGGVGYLALYLASLGHAVTTTDVEPALSSVLRPNVEANASVMARSGGTVDVRALDWEEFAHDEADNLTRAKEWASQSLGANQPFDTLISTDTIYHPSLIRPLLCTLRAFSLLGPATQRAPPILVALERRDPALVDAALQQAREMGFDTKRVGQGRVGKCLQKAGWGSWLRVMKCTAVRERGCGEEEESEEEEDGTPCGSGGATVVEEEPQPDRAAWEGVEIWNWRYVGPRPHGTIG